MTAGDRVSLVDGRAGQIIGWQGDRPIVALDNGCRVTVALDELRKAR